MLDGPDSFESPWAYESLAESFENPSFGREEVLMTVLESGGGFCWQRVYLLRAINDNGESAICAESKLDLNCICSCMDFMFKISQMRSAVDIVHSPMYAILTGKNESVSQDLLRRY